MKELIIAAIVYAILLVGFLAFVILCRRPQRNPEE